MKKILIIEDDQAIRKGLRDNLELDNYEVITESDGEEGLKSAENKSPDLILLDLNLPMKNGYEICKALRSAGNNVPIIMLSARAEEADKVLGLELGADDYVTKPFSIRELLSRIKAVLRRKATIEDVMDIYTIGEIEINFRKMEASKGKKKIYMSLKEYEILKFFINHKEEVVSRNLLLDEVWGYEVFPTTRTVDNYIMMLRKKIEKNPSVPKHFLTIHSAGYRFVN
ncbi:MAG TPA: response regulator transcription factor [Ignavibacteria bacterium]